jgi:hypothetical protein
VSLRIWNVSSEFPYRKQYAVIMEIEEGDTTYYLMSGDGQVAALKLILRDETLLNAKRLT